MVTALWAIGAAIVSSVISAVATFFLKLAAPHMSLSLKKLFRNWRMFIGILMYGCSTIIFLFALRAAELSVIYPFIALQYIWANFLSKRYLNENITSYKWAGVALVLLGVVLIGMGA